LSESHKKGSHDISSRVSGVFYHVLLHTPVLLYQTKPNRYTHMSSYHHFINTLHNSSVTLTLNGHLLTVQSKQCNNVSQQNYITRCKIKLSG